MLIPVSLCNISLSSIIFLALTFAVSEIDVITPVFFFFLITVSLFLNTLFTYFFLVIRKFKLSISLCVCVLVSHSIVSDFVTPWTVCSPPGSSVCGILQARILEWVAISFSRGSSWSRNWTWVSHIAGRLWETPQSLYVPLYLKLLSCRQQLRLVLWFTLTVHFLIGILNCWHLKWLLILYGWVPLLLTWNCHK